MLYKKEINKAIIKNEIIQKKFRKTFLDKTSIKLIEKFIIENELICYGGTAINNILPEKHKFYDYELEIPDYDFYSYNALYHCKKLAKILSNKYENVEAKSSLHKGTYKIFVNFLPLVDVTQITDYEYNILLSNVIIINNIYHCSLRFLKMSLYSELSRPLGDISRWNKNYNRLELLHKLNIKNSNKLLIYIIPDDKIKIYIKIVKLCIKHKLVLMGDFGLSWYKDYLNKDIKKILNNTKLKQIFILHYDIEFILKLFKGFDIKKYPKKGELSQDIYEIKIDDYSIAYIFINYTCQSYNKINNFCIASIDTILSVYYSIEYNNTNINMNNIFLYCDELEKIHKSNKTNVLRRFYMPCIGIQDTIEDIIHTRNNTYKKYKNDKNNIKYKELFFKYYPKTKKK